MSELKPCPFCGAVEDLQLLTTGDLLHWSCFYDCEKDHEDVAPFSHEWFVNCPSCGTCGPSVIISKFSGVLTDDDCKEKAIKHWNERASA